jgi:hypothetical protein
MSRSFLSSLLVTSIILGSATARGSALRCNDVFRDHRDVLSRQAVDERPRFLRNIVRKRLPRIGEWLNQVDAKSQKRRLDKMLDSFDVESSTDRARLERYVAELTIEIYGSRTNLFSWLKSKDARLEKQALDLVREKVLREGLGAIVEIAAANQRPGLLKRLGEIQGRVRNALGRWVGFPLKLPGLDNVEMPRELFEKILRDGYQPHAKEFESLIGKKQTGIDAYNTFKRFYGVVVFVALFFYFQFDTEIVVREEIQKEAREAIQPALRELDRTERFADNVGANADEVIKQRKFAEALQRFRTTYGEDPTPEERTWIRDEIWKRI